LTKLFVAVLDHNVKTGTRASCLTCAFFSTVSYDHVESQIVVHEVTKLVLSASFTNCTSSQVFAPLRSWVGSHGALVGLVQHVDNWLLIVTFFGVIKPQVLVVRAVATRWQVPRSTPSAAMTSTALAAAPTRHIRREANGSWCLAFSVSVTGGCAFVAILADLPSVGRLTAVASVF